MQANVKRHISTGHQFSHLIPQSISRDTIVVGKGKAHLSDTLKLIQQMIHQTLDDTKVLALKLKGRNVLETCKNIWQFVYGHIQYKMDATGIEQVRRPSRTWVDRKTGVDCDCYTVFIGSILTNLGIPFKMRITKYGGKQHFQHIYPVVLTGDNKHITIDCVTDRFDYEAPYSEKRDIGIKDALIINDLSGLSGVDMVDISLNALEQPRIPLHQILRPAIITMPSIPCNTMMKSESSEVRKQGRTVSPFRLQSSQRIQNLKNDNQGLGLWNYFLISTISVAAGIGVIKLFTNTKKKPSINSKKATGFEK